MLVTSPITWLVALVVVVVGQTIDGVDDEFLFAAFGTPPPDVASTSPPDGDDVTATVPPDEVDQSEEDCECVPFSRCSNRTLNEYGAGIIDMRFGAKCSDILEQCCTRENIVPESHLPPPPPPPPTTTTTALSVGCGIRNKRGVVFELAGFSEGESNFAEFPWMTAVMEKTSNQVHCGGSLIHLQVVLSAAHCLGNLDPGDLKTRAGEWNMESTSEPYAYQERDVKRIVVHEAYSRRDVRNDVALIFLAAPFDAAPHVGVVCLPTQDQSVNHRRCLVTGWGKEKFEHRHFDTKILKSIELPIMPRDRCLKAFRTTRLGSGFKLHNSFICAGGEEGKDACTGDGGGPLVCPLVPGLDLDIDVRVLTFPTDQQERYIQAGIVAWGIGCGQRGIPGAYVGVSFFRNWIDHKMAQEGFHTDSYTVPDYEEHVDK